jgi:hypothetical protein
MLLRQLTNRRQLGAGRRPASMPLPGSPSHQLYFAVSGAYPQLLKELNAGLVQI